MIQACKENTESNKENIVYNRQIHETHKRVLNQQ